MRPGQETPDKETVPVGYVHLDVASMRPGQETPDKRPGPSPSGTDSRSFNEAGARNPG